MVAKPRELERVDVHMREAIRQYAELVRELAGENALALTLFGAIAAGTFDVSIHTARNVLVLQEADLNFLRRLSEKGAKLGKTRISAPLIMTPEYIKASLDTFPLEFIEIQQKNLTLFGEDHFADLAFEDAHVRHQCERELKAVLIRMRQGLLAAAGRDKVLSALESDATEGLIRTLRGILWLNGHKDARPAAEVVTEAEKISDRMLSGVRRTLAPNTPHDWDSFTKLYADIEALGKFVDAW